MDPLSHILSYRPISVQLATSGQPTEGQIGDIARAGFQVVINLGLHGADYALADERHSVERHRMVYEHVPVAWQKPVVDDFQRFLRIMERHKGKRIFLHCAANKRVSVFLMLYQVFVENRAEEEAMRDLFAVWEPEPVWWDFIQQVRDNATTTLHS